ncbi:MAG: MFS transporter [Christensenellales bacterium]|nr:MFS transporter [Clostridiales bacterium]
MEKRSWKRTFFTIQSGQAISLITSSALQMALIFYLTEKTNSSMTLALATLVGFLPQGVLGLFIGGWIDRHSRKRIMIGADLFIAAVSALLAVISAFLDPPVWVVLAILFLRSIGSAFHTPSINAVTPLIVPTDKLAKCTGYIQSLQSVSSIVSPALGALLYAQCTLTEIIALDVVGAVIASIAVMLVKIPNIDVANIPQSEGVLAGAKEAYRILAQQKGLLTLLWMGALYMFAYMPINALFPLISMNHFGGTTWHVAMSESVFAAGMLLGGIVLGVWGGFQRKTTTVLLSIAVMGIALLIAGILPASGFIAFVVCCAIMGFSAPFYGVQTAIYQEMVSPEYLGRVFSLSLSTMSLAMPLGLIAAGCFADMTGVETWFAISGIFIAGIAVVGAVLPSIKELYGGTKKDK